MGMAVDIKEVRAGAHVAKVEGIIYAERSSEVVRERVEGGGCARWENAGVGEDVGGWDGEAEMCAEG